MFSRLEAATAERRILLVAAVSVVALTTLVWSSGCDEDRSRGRSDAPMSLRSGAQENSLVEATSSSPFGLQACRSNRFISDWQDAAFRSSHRSLTTFRGHLIDGAHGSRWGAEGHARFFHPELQQCSPKARVGEGDGGKWVCGLPSLQKGCIIYSVGSNFLLDFEMELLETTPCDVYTFDCTVATADDRFAKVYGNLPPRLHFFPYCIGSADGRPADQQTAFRTFAQIAQELGHSNVAFVKFDIEGYEYEVIESMYRDFLVSKATGGVPMLPDQVLFEQHAKSQMGLKWGNNDRGLAAGEMALTWLQLADMGYVPVNVEPNVNCPHCVEFVVVRAFC